MLKKLVGFLILLGLFFAIARQTSSKVHIERDLKMPIDKVWNYWTQEQMILQWWGPKDYSSTKVSHEFKPGGKLLMSMKSPSGDIIWNAGVYKEIEFHKKIVSTLSFSDQEGNVMAGKDVPVPGDWPDEVLVTVEFEDTGSGTRIQITEEGIPLIMYVFAKMGWNQQLDKFEKLP